MLQRKLECLEQPQLLVTSIPCPQASGKGAWVRCALCSGPAAGNQRCRLAPAAPGLPPAAASRVSGLVATPCRAGRHPFIHLLPAAVPRWRARCGAGCHPRSCTLPTAAAHTLTCPYSHPAHTPQAVVDLSNYLRGLGFEDAPNHHYMRSLLGKLDGPTVDPHSRPQSGDMAAAAALAAAQQASGTAEVAPGSSAGHPAAAQETAAAPAEASLPNGRHQQHGTPAGWEAGRGGGVMLASSRPASRASSPRGGATAGAAADRRPSRLGRQDEVQQQQQQGMAPPAAGKEQRADPREGRRQQGQEGAAAPLSGQRSRDRSRERGRDEGRGRRRRSDSPSSDRSRSSRSYSRSSSSRRSGSASRSRSRGRERGRRSRSSSRSRSRDRERERRAREYSRERGRRSRSRDRGSRRSRSRARERERERDRERAREREREQERARARRRSSRSRSGDRYARRNDSAAAAAPARRRSRSRSPYAGSSRVQQRRGSGSGAKEAALAAAAPAATAAREAAHAPAEGAGGQAPAGGAPAGHAEPAAVPQYTTDMHAQYRAGLELVFALRWAAAALLACGAPLPCRRPACTIPPVPLTDKQARPALAAACCAFASCCHTLKWERSHATRPSPAAPPCLPGCRQGGLSEAGAAACRQLRGLEPAEAAGVVCWLIDELATGGWAGWAAGHCSVPACCRLAGGRGFENAASQCSLACAAH